MGFLLVNLTDLNLRGNKITRVGRLIGYPKIQALTLDKNPIEEIAPAAFRDCPDLGRLSVAEIQLPNYQGDLKFLNHC